VYDGFLWNFEDNEFVLLDGRGFRNWFLIRSRLGDRLLLRFKATVDHLLTRTNVQPRDLNNQPVYPAEFPGDNVRDQVTSFRVQLDYTF